MREIHLHYLNAPDVEALALTDDEIIGAVEVGLAAQGRREAVIEPRMHLVPDPAVQGHFNVLRGAFRAPINLAGVKVISDYVDNYKQGLPSEVGLLLLMDPSNGVPQGDHRRQPPHRHAHRRGDGHRREASRAQRIRACSGTSARAAPPTGTCACSIICSASTKSACIRAGPESRDAFAARLSRDLGKPVTATDDWRSCVEGADIVVEASRLAAPEPMLKTAWIKPGALVVPYGTMSAVELSLTDIMDKMVVDDWGQCKSGQFGSLRAHVEAGKLSESNAARRDRRDRRGPQDRAANATTRRSCSGTAACRSPTSRSVTRCWRRPRVSASASACATHDARRQRPDVCGHAGREGRMAGLVRVGREDIRRAARPPSITRRRCAARSAVGARRSRRGVHVRLSVRVRQASTDRARGAGPLARALRRKAALLHRFRGAGGQRFRRLERHRRRTHRLDRRPFAVGLQRGAAPSRRQRCALRGVDRSVGHAAPDHRRRAQGRDRCRPARTRMCTT